MAVSNIIVKGIKPDLSILGNIQRFIFSDSTSYFGLRNDFVPTSNIPSLVGFDFSNNSFSGFRFTYQTPFNQNLGSFKLKSYVNNDSVGTDIFTVNNNALTFNSAVDFAIAPLFNDPTQDLHAANKRYVDNHTWFVSSITNFDASVRSYKLNDFLAPTGNISLNNNTITSLANPVNNSDAANRAFVDSKTWMTSQITNFNATVIAFRLDQFAVPNANLNLNTYRITGSGTPILSTDLTTKSFVESSITSGISGVPTAVTLTGDVTGSGNTGSSITTTLNKRLDQITAPTSSVNLNSQKIINLATPVLSTDAATRGFIDGKTWTASQITDFDTQVRLSRLDQMALPTSSLNVNSQKIINLAAPVLSTDGVNRNYADTSTIAPSRISNFPNDSTKYLSGNGNWITPAGGGDTYQTLTSASSVTWNADNGNIAILTLSTNVTLNINIGLKTRLVLIVKQDNTGNRTLTLPSGIYRFSGSSSVVAPITTTANAIDVLIFIKDEANKLYLQQVNNNFTLTVAPPTQNFIQVNSPFGSSTYVSQSIIQNWYNSYSGNPSPNTANPASVYPGLVAVSGWCVWLGSTNWYYASGSWNNMTSFGSGGVPGDFAANIAAIARGL